MWAPLPFANGAITPITPTRAHRMAITARTGLLTESLSA